VIGMQWRPFRRAEWGIMRHSRMKSRYSKLWYQLPISTNSNIGSSKHHFPSRDLGMARDLFPCNGVLISFFVSVNAYRYCEGGELFYFVLNRKNSHREGSSHDNEAKLFSFESISTKTQYLIGTIFLMI